MKTNYDEIAKGWIVLLKKYDAENSAVLSFGMIPLDRFQGLMNEYFSVFAEKLVEPGAKYHGMNAQYVEKCFSEVFKQKEEDRMVKAIYRNADMVV